MKKLRNKKIFGILSVLDICIIFVALLLLLSVYKVMSDKKINGNSTITYVVRIKTCEDYYAKNIDKNKIIYDSVKNNKVGIIKNVRIEPAIEYTYDNNTNTYKKVEIVERDDVYITIESKVHENDKNLLLNSTDIKVGAELYLKGKGYHVVGEVIEIERNDNNEK